jgi:hypothetical protein
MKHNFLSLQKLQNNVSVIEQQNMIMEQSTFFLSKSAKLVGNQAEILIC